MGISGGGDRSLLRPLRPDGHVQHDLGGVTVIGNLKGDAYGLCIANPRPGLVHQYADEQANRGSVIRAQQRGWRRADPEVDGCPLGVLMGRQSSTHTPTNSVESGLYPGLVHLVTTEENFRRIQEERAEANREAVDPTANEFLDGAVADVQSDAAQRFALRSHSTTFMEGDHVVEQLMPNGVLRGE